MGQIGIGQGFCGGKKRVSNLSHADPLYIMYESSKGSAGSIFSGLPVVTGSRIGVQSIISSSSMTQLVEVPLPSFDCFQHKISTFFYMCLHFIAPLNWHKIIYKKMKDPNTQFTCSFANLAFFYGIHIYISFSKDVLVYF